jgi:hypothetical protein
MVPFNELAQRGENMKLLKNLLVVIATTGAMASAQGQTLPPIDLGILSPAGSVATATFASASFLDTVTFQLDATHHTVTGTTTGTNVSNLSFQLFADGGITPVSTALDLHQDLTPGGYHALISGDLATGAASGQFKFAVAANPEPAEWMLLLCGLVVAGFIARRKIGLAAA